MSKPVRGKDKKAGILIWASTKISCGRSKHWNKGLDNRPEQMLFLSTIPRPHLNIIFFLLSLSLTELFSAVKILALVK